MPVLAAGAHEGPERGGCFTEIASLLAGEPWSDRPRTIDPTLAVIARLVNDAVSAPARARLARLIPAALGTNTGQARLPTALARVTADVARAYGVVAPALIAPPPASGAVDPPDRTGGWRARARRRQRLRRGRRQARTVVAAAVAELTYLPPAEADAALTELLHAATGTARQHAHPRHGAAVTGPRSHIHEENPMPGHWVAASELHPHDLIRLDNAPVVELTTVRTAEVVQLTGWAHDDPDRRVVTATCRPREQLLWIAPVILEALTFGKDGADDSRTKVSGRAAGTRRGDGV